MSISAFPETMPMPSYEAKEGKGNKMSIPTLPSITGGASGAGLDNQVGFGKTTQINAGGTVQSILMLAGFGVFLWLTRKK